MVKKYAATTCYEMCWWNSVEEGSRSPVRMTQASDGTASHACPGQASP